MVERKDLDSCWNWTGNINDSGYGRFGYSGKNYRAHRIAFALMNDLNPETVEEIDHQCHNKKCCNPFHLKPVSHKENMENRAGANRNSKTKIRGVTWNKLNKNWRVQLQSDGVFYQGGSYKDIKQAEVAAVELRNKIFKNNKT